MGKGQKKKNQSITPSPGLPIFTVITGHAGTHLDSNTDAFLALGIPQHEHKDLLLALSLNAVRRTHHCLVHYKRLCRGSRSDRAPAGVG